MSAAEDIAACESALRDLIRTIDGSSWEASFSAEQLTRFEAARTEDLKRRRGTAPNNDLLDYVELYHLQTHIVGAWGRYAAALKKQRTFEVYLERLLGLRNAVAHSRPLLPFETQLVGGITGEIRNLVVLHRNIENPDHELWPIIEEARDQFGTTRTFSSPFPVGQDMVQLAPGDRVTFTARGRDAGDVTLLWRCGRNMYDDSIGTAEGETVTFEWTVEERDIGGGTHIHIVLASDRAHHRHEGFDASASFAYFVRPGRLAHDEN